MNITGPGADLLTIDAAGNSRVLYLNSEAAGTTISGLTITGGSAYNGAGIWDEEAGEAPNLLILDHVVVTGNTSGFGGGGGVFAGNLHLVDSVVTGNHAPPGRGGGGLFIVSGDGVPGNVLIERSTVSDNTAYTCGGGLYFGSLHSTLTVIDSTFSGNTATVSYGGAIDVDGNFNTVTIANSTFSGNRAPGGGGLHADQDNVVQIAMTTITGNTATNDEDPYYAAGGINLRSGDTPGPPVLDTSAAASTGASGSKHDDAHVQDAPTHTSSLELVGVILAGNHAPAGMPTDLGVGVNSRHPATTVQADSSMGGGLSTNVTLAGTRILRGSDPKLGPLADNGGPTLTPLPLAGSPVIDAGPAVVPDFPGNADDQRGPGYDRTSGLATDIGAVEVQVPKPAPEPEPTFTG